MIWGLGAWRHRCKGPRLAQGRVPKQPREESIAGRKNVLLARFRMILGAHWGFGLPWCVHGAVRAHFATGASNSCDRLLVIKPYGLKGL